MLVVAQQDGIDPAHPLRRERRADGLGQHNAADVLSRRVEGRVGQESQGTISTSAVGPPMRVILISFAISHPIWQK